MVSVTLGQDLGASGSKVVYQIDGKNSGRFLITPYLRETSSDITALFSDHGLGSRSIDQMYVQLQPKGNLFLLGELAKQMKGEIRLKCPK